MITTIPNAGGRGPDAGRDYRLGRGGAAVRPEAGRAADVVPPAKPMGNGEKARICREAAAAFKYQVENGQLADFHPNLPEYKRCQEWRREEIARHFGLSSLTLATQDQFNNILAHFQSFTPQQMGLAYKRLMRGDGEANRRRQALWKIKKACEAGGLAWPAYPLSIATTQFRVPTLDDLTAAQAWKLFFTLTGRSRTHQKAQKAAVRERDEEVEPF